MEKEKKDLQGVTKKLATWSKVVMIVGVIAVLYLSIGLFVRKVAGWEAILLFLPLPVFLGYLGKTIAEIGNKLDKKE